MRFCQTSFSADMVKPWNSVLELIHTQDRIYRETNQPDFWPTSDLILWWWSGNLLHYKNSPYSTFTIWIWYCHLMFVFYIRPRKCAKLECCLTHHLDWDTKIKKIIFVWDEFGMFCFIFLGLWNFQYLPEKVFLISVCVNSKCVWNGNIYFKDHNGKWLFSKKN